MASTQNETNAKRLDVAALESWLWEVACQIRGPLDAPKFKDYILPLIFLKRLSDDGGGKKLGHFGGVSGATVAVDI